METHLNFGTIPLRSPKIDRAYVTAICICVKPFPFGYHRTLVEVVTGAACEHNYLKAAAFLFEQRAEPIHAALVTLNQLVIEHDNRL